MQSVKYVFSHVNRKIFTFGPSFRISVTKMRPKTNIFLFSGTKNIFNQNTYLTSSRYNRIEFMKKDWTTSLLEQPPRFQCLEYNEIVV